MVISQTLALLISTTWVTIHDGAMLACAESSQDFDDAHGVLQVVINRVNDPRWPNTAIEVMHQPSQFYLVCNPDSLHPYHFVLGWKMLTNDLSIPEWMDDKVQFFCADRIVKRWEGRRVKRGQITHHYYGS